MNNIVNSDKLPPGYDNWVRVYLVAEQYDVNTVLFPGELGGEAKINFNPRPFPIYQFDLLYLKAKAFEEMMNFYRLNNHSELVDIIYDFVGMIHTKTDKQHSALTVQAIKNHILR